MKTGEPAAMTFLDAMLRRGAEGSGYAGLMSAADCRVAIAEIGRLQESKMAMHDEFEQLNPGGHIRLDPAGCGISTYTAWIVRNNLDQLRAIVEDARKPYEHTQLHAVYRLLEHNLFTVFGDVMPLDADGKRRWPTEQDAAPTRVPLRGRPNGTVDQPHPPARQAILIAAITAAVKAVEGMDREVGKAYGGSTSALGPFMIGVTVEKVS